MTEITIHDLSDEDAEREALLDALSCCDGQDIYCGHYGMIPEYPYADQWES